MSNGGAGNDKDPSTPNHGLADEHQENYIIYPSARLGAMTRKRRQISAYLQNDPVDASKLTSLKEEFSQKISNFKQACEFELSKEKLTDYDISDFRAWFRQHLDVNSDFVSHIESLIEKSAKGETLQKSDLNQVSCRPKAKNVSDNKAKYDSDTKTKNDNDINYIKQWDEESETSLSDFNGPNDQSCSMNNITELIRKQNEISMLLATTQARSTLPLTEPDIFDGSNILDYQSFIVSFDRTVVQRTNDYADMFYCLLKYTKGEAKSLVSSCNRIDSAEAYKSARKLLEQHYGNEYMIANKYLEKLEKWKNIKSEDSVGLHELSLFLTRCASMMQNMTSLNQLNSLKEIRDIVKKLPYDMRKKFRDYAGQILESGKTVDFDILVKFVQKQSRLLQIPLLGDIKDFSRKEKPVEKKVFSTSVSDEKTKCPCCGKNNHNLDRCVFFNKKTIKDKEDFVRKNKLCFGCLKSNHMSKECKSKITCKTCSKYHPTSLHRNDKPKNTENTIKNDVKEPPSTEAPPQNTDVTDVSSHHVKTEGMKSDLIYPSILVDLKFEGSPDVVRTYMGLDPFSSDCFIDEKLLNRECTKPYPIELSVTTMEKNKSKSMYGKVSDISIASVDGKTFTTLESAYTKSNWPFTTKESPSPSNTKGYNNLESLPIAYDNEKYIGISIGMNRSDILKPLEAVYTTRYGPYATKHMFGWAVSGCASNSKFSKISCYHVKVEENDFSLEDKFDSCFSRDFEDHDDSTTCNSIEDNQWLTKVQSSIKLLNNKQFEICLPIKDNVILPNNYDQALYRVNSLKKKFSNDPISFNEYSAFMTDMLGNDYAEIVPNNEIDYQGNIWYLSHFAVRHKQKKKLRIVYDCSLKYKGISLNDVLLQGPDLANSLVGVLLRFREGKYAFSADIQQMFYRVRVPVDDSNYLRFLWFPDNDLTEPPQQYRLNVHVFGAKSSPSCANFALRSTVSKSDEVNNCILKNFYVDDVLKSCNDENQAVNLAHNLISTLFDHSFNLTGFFSNSCKLLNSLPLDKLSEKVKEVNIGHDNLPCEKALGVVWHVQSDTFCIRIDLPEQTNVTKRSLLSTLFRIYDPLFLVSPVIMYGKRIFQESCQLKTGWDDDLSPDLSMRWKKWTSDLHLLNSYAIKRCYTISNCNFTSQLHVFSDGSMTAYGAVAYIRCSDTSGNVKSNIVMSKARLTPINRNSLKTVPRIELNAAKLAVILQQQIIKESGLKFEKSVFWSDSTIISVYINNDEGRFQRFVHNRISYIRSKTETNQWRHIPGKLNPADILSRGVKNIQEFLQNATWKYGPEFLSSGESNWPPNYVKGKLKYNDVELIKNTSTYVTQQKSDPVQNLIDSTSSWFKLKCRVAYILRLKNFLRCKDPNNLKDRLNVDELKSAELNIWRFVQQNEMKHIFESLNSKNGLPKNSNLNKLTPFIDHNGIIRVGGRLKKSDFHNDVKQPILISTKPNVINLYCEHVHRELGHLGKEVMLAHIRQTLHIIGISSIVKKLLRKCIICRKVQGKTSTQLMGDLPVERVKSDIPPFTHTGTDYFGPFYVTRGRGRTQEKRYGVIFTCMSSRAMHLEVSNSLDADSFINALRRFISRRGPPVSLWSDNGTNFVKSNKDLNDAVTEWNSNQVNDWCKAKNIDWKFNPPSAPHCGGVWEREIRSVKKILYSITNDIYNKSKLTDEILYTWLCEIENILNTRPLTSVTTDPNDLGALTPNHLLRLNTNIMFPQGIYEEKSYPRRRWRQVQHLAEKFWTRWRREYALLLNIRQKWKLPKRSFQIGDLVMITDQILPRNQWSIGRIVKVNKDSNNFVRSVQIKVPKYKKGNDFHIGINYLDRPIHKLVLICTSDDLENV